MSKSNDITYYAATQTTHVLQYQRDMTQLCGGVTTDMMAEPTLTRCANRRAENSLLPYLRRERAMQRFRWLRNLQKSASVHVPGVNPFNWKRSLQIRPTVMLSGAAVLAEWRQCCAASKAASLSKRRLVRMNLTARTGLLGNAIFEFIPRGANP